MEETRSTLQNAAQGLEPKDSKKNVTALAVLFMEQCVTPCGKLHKSASTMKAKSAELGVVETKLESCKCPSFDTVKLIIKEFECIIGIDPNEKEKQHCLQCLTPRGGVGNDVMFWFCSMTSRTPPRKLARKESALRP
eukprot:g4384.t1